MSSLGYVNYYYDCFSIPCVHVLPFTPDYSVLELYLRGRGGQELRGALIRSQTSHDSLSSVWSELLPQCVNILLTQLYPFLYSSVVLFLLPFSYLKLV